MSILSILVNLILGVIVSLLTIFNSIPTYQMPILCKYVVSYKAVKYQSFVRYVGELFKDVAVENLGAACELIASSTPLMQSVFLKRGDLEERYLLKGIKALSKLSTQKDIDAKIDFKLLEKLQPIGRLRAMKQLLGMYDGYFKVMQFYKKRYSMDNFYTNRAKERYEQNGKHELPFKEIPTRDEIGRFLFPCLVKYNEQVTQLMEKYDEMIERTKQTKEPVVG